MAELVDRLIGIGYYDDPDTQSFQLVQDLMLNRRAVLKLVDDDLGEP